MIIQNLILFIIILFIKINITNEEVDECLYAIQREKECFKIPINDAHENCCYLEMDLNQITTTACIRIKNEETEIEKRIFQIKENEEYYTLENIIIKCLSYHISFSYIIFILFLLI